MKIDWERFVADGAAIGYAFDPTQFITDCTQCYSNRICIIVHYEDGEMRWVCKQCCQKDLADMREEA